MCRQAGLIMGARRRRAPEREVLLDLFTEMLVASEHGGPHATGVAVLDTDGGSVIAKSPGRASDFVGSAGFLDAITRFGNRTTLLMGHTRWRTRGTEFDNRNNHPIRAGDVIGTHNGTILNADELFRLHRLPRHAEVDSELLFRLADQSCRDGAVRPDAFRRLLARCRGQMSAILASRRDPGTVFALKGNRPLAFRCSQRLQVVAYATDARVLDTAIATACGAVDEDWQTMCVGPMTMLLFRREAVLSPEALPFRFVPQAMHTIVPQGVDE